LAIILCYYMRKGINCRPERSCLQGENQLARMILATETSWQCGLAQIKFPARFSTTPAINLNSRYPTSSIKMGARKKAMRKAMRDLKPVKSGKIAKTKKSLEDKSNSRKVNRQQIERANDTAKKNQKPQSARQTIPFEPNDHLLLVGEGTTRIVTFSGTRKTNVVLHRRLLLRPLHCLRARLR